MTLLHDSTLLYLIAGVIAFLAVATIIGQVLAATARGRANSVTIDNLNQRINAWWVMVVVFLLTLLTGTWGRCILFCIISFLALREFITLTPVGTADHAPLVWSFFIVTPIQYFLIAINAPQLYTVFIPVYAFLFLTIRMALVGENRNFLVRGAVVQLALMLCVYCPSYAAALGGLTIDHVEDAGAKLLVFLVFIAQISDVFQYIAGKLFGRHALAPRISPNKTWEGLAGGLAVATGLGWLLSWITPFPRWQSALFALLIAGMGFFGGLTMSVIKRDRGVKDFGTLIPGHGGVLDRMDSLLFASPIFFQLVLHFYAAVPLIVKVVKRL